jgi:hypothetical protein
MFYHFINRWWCNTVDRCLNCFYESYFLNVSQRPLQINFECYYVVGASRSLRRNELFIAGLLGNGGSAATKAHIADVGIPKRDRDPLRPL